jgi:hypothetical protein
VIIISTSSKKNIFHFSKEWVSVSENFFQQDGAWSHAADAVLNIHDEHFDNEVLSNRFTEQLGHLWSWSSYS